MWCLRVLSSIGKIRSTSEHKFRTRTKSCPDHIVSATTSIALVTTGCFAEGMENAFVVHANVNPAGRAEPVSARLVRIAACRRTERFATTTELVFAVNASVKTAILDHIVTFVL